mgnify:CR=1 FL=1
MQAFRAGLLRFDGDNAVLDSDGLVVINAGQIEYAGDFDRAPAQ